ncbi:MAG: hypothetical protein ABW065_04560 [Solirubrobacterales bacterium]
MRKGLLIPLLGLLVAMIGAAPAKATLTIEEFKATATDGGNALTTEAGAHPDFRTHIKLGNDGSPEVAKNITFDLPPGMFGNPSVLTRCTSREFSLQECPPNSQAGYIAIHAGEEEKEVEPDPVNEPGVKVKETVPKLLGLAPIFTVEPGPDEAARFAFYVPTLNIPIVIPVTVRPDYGLRFTVSNITQAVPLSEADLTFWGFPAASRSQSPFVKPEPWPHDEERFLRGSPGKPAGCSGEAFESFGMFCIVFYNLESSGFAIAAVPASVPNRPFTGNPSVCAGPLPASLAVETYQRPGVLVHAADSYPPITGCERQNFQPVTQAQLTTSEADAPSGLNLQFTIPQAQTKAVSPSSLRATTLTLPEGLTINPDAADGQSSCPDAEAEFGTEVPAHCPDRAKVGTVTLKSESLPDDLNGSIYLGEPKPGNQYRLFLIAQGFGIKAKLIGKLLPDPNTGQVTVSFENLPQLPLEKFEMHIFASDRGILATPTQCAVYAVQTDMFPWNNALADQKGQFGLSITSGPNGKPCPVGKRPFEPKLNAGTSNSEAGSFSSFTLNLDREDGDQYLKDLGFTMPPGLLGSLRGITYCPESAISAAAGNSGMSEQSSPSCPSSSQVGTTNVAAGPGTHPFHAVGRMFMAGPFKGAPLSMVAITPALAGPYDYGTVVVRVALNVDSQDAHVTALSDTVPQIIGGIPLRIRQIQVNLDKPNFILNPTNCQPMSVLSKGIGAEGTTTDFASYFQAANCATLPFKPKMGIRYLSGGKARAKNPALEFHLATRPGDANIKSLAVTLSKAFAIDQRHLGNICSEAQLAATKCQGKQPIGSAVTKTPLLDQPLSGPVYAVSGGGGLPRLAFVLDGQVPLVPRAKSSSAKGALKTVVPIIPDAPIGDFRLTLLGAKQGYLINTRGLCNKPVISTVEYQAQNGAKLTENVKAKAPCGGKSKAKKKQKRQSK